MWIEERNGKFRACERYTDYMTGKTKRVSVTLEKNTAAARRLAAEELNRMIDNKYEKKRENYTLKDLVEQYRIYQKNTVKASTYTRNYHACNALMSILGEDILQDKLNAAYIKKKFLETKKSPGTLNEHRTRLNALLRWGYENDYISDISFLSKFKPFDDVPHREKIEDKFLESHEVKTLLDSMDDTLWKSLTEFLILSGLRFGEAAALEVSDVDKNDRLIHVRHTYDCVNKVVSTPKTGFSIRDVYMQDELLKLVKEISVYMKLQSLSAGYDNPHNLFFQSKSGGYIQFYSYAKYLKEHAMKSIGRSITPHTLRHTHASLLLEQGISVDAISRRLGHHDSKITKDIYLHVTEKLKEKDNEEIRKIKII